jgi:FkbM family methyltransferase
MNLNEKRKFLLENLERNYTKIKKWEKYLGPGIKRKIQRLIFLPEIYIPYTVSLTLKPKNVKINLFDKKKIILDINDYNSATLYAFKCLNDTAEYKLTKFFIKNLRTEDIFYDIGGNYGFYTYLALEFCKEVHYFEPLPFVFENVKKNLENEPRAILNNIALSDKKEKLILYLPENKSGVATILSEIQKIFPKCKKIEVNSLSLEEYLKHNTTPTVIKMDVEGAESKIIDGGINFLRQNSPLIAMEVWSKKERGEISMVAVEKLRNLGYKSYFIDLNGELQETKGDLSKKVMEENLTNDNFVFLKSE